TRGQGAESGRACRAACVIAFDYAMPADKKIIIDEDWKSQVQAEKEGAAEAKVTSKPAEQTGGADAATDLPMPPASFEMLLTTLATEALVALGQVPHPVTGKPQ